MIKTCSRSIGSISKAECFSKYGQIIALFLDQNKDGLSREDALLLATWQAKIDAEDDVRMIVLNPDKPLNVTSTKEDNTFVEGNTGKKTRAKKGKFSLQLEYDDLTLCFASSLQKLDGAKLYGYFITENGAIISDGDEINTTPVELQIYVGDPIPPESNSNVWTLKIDVEIVPTSNYFKVAILPTDKTTDAWSPLDLEGIKTIKVENLVGDATAGTLDFDVVGKCSGAEISSFITETDWLVALGSAISTYLTITAISNVDNHYTLSVTGLSAAEHLLWRKSNYDSTDKGFETDFKYSVIPVA